MFVCLSVCMSVCLYVCLFVCLSVCLFVCLSVCLSVSRANMLITSRTIKPSNLIGQIILSPFLGEGLSLHKPINRSRRVEIPLYGNFQLYITFSISN